MKKEKSVTSSKKVSKNAVIKAILVITVLLAGIGFAMAAWDDTKSTGDTLTASEWNAMVNNQKSRINSVTLVVAASDSSSQSKAAANYVCDGTDDQVEINNAISALPSYGGTVRLMEGTYRISGAINAVSNLVLEGCGWENTKLLMRYSDSAIDLLGYDNITIRDIEIDGDNRAYVSGTNNEIIDGTGNEDVTIEHIYIHDCGTAYGIELWNAKRLRILNSKFTRIGNTADSDPISIQESEDVTISGNYVYDNVYEYRAGAIEVQDGSGKIIITNNHVSKSQGGLSLTVHNAGEHNTEFIVADNIIEVYNVDLETNTGHIYPYGISMQGISDTPATRYIITGNIINANVDNHNAVANVGISVKYANGAVISSNIINNIATNQENGNYGIYIGDNVANTTISSNLCMNCYYAGIKLEGSNIEDIIITDNRCGGSEIGIDIVNGDYLIIRQNNCRGNSVDGVNVTTGQNSNGIEGDNLE